MNQLFTASHVITPDEDLSAGWVLVRDGKIAAVGGGDPPESDARLVDLAGLTLVPGFVDIHVHGGGGFSLLSGDSSEACEHLKWVTTSGVTSVMPTVCAGSTDEATSLIRALSSIRCSVGAADVVGLNLEGPFVSPARLGALPASWSQRPDRRILENLSESAAGSLRMITVAPEVEGCLELSALATARGIVASVGHTDATFAEAEAAFRGGASHVTHALNAMRPFHHRDPGVIGAALTHTEVTIEVIADGVHLHPGTVKLLVRAFGPSRVALVTDAVTPAGLEHGTFRIGHEEAMLRAGRITLADGTIAGSAATMDSLVRNVVNWGCATLPDAILMASTVPAGVAAAGDRKGRIAPGYDADLVALTPELEVAATWVGGQTAYSTIDVLPAD